MNKRKIPITCENDHETCLCDYHNWEREQINEAMREAIKNE